jgi:Fe-S-cluster containining protein
MFFVGTQMVDTFYLQLEFEDKTAWSINLPFLCNKCGNCCTLEDFLTAGKLNAEKDAYPEVHDRVKALYDELGDMWAADEAKYDNYLMSHPCPFLVNKSCSIYEIRPEGCRLFPKTAFGMLTHDCEPLNRFKKMRSALKKGRTAAETYCLTGKPRKPTDCNEPVKPGKFSDKQYQACLASLHQAGITDDELTLFKCFNGK